jgi:hypothetical protein
MGNIFLRFLLKLFKPIFQPPERLRIGHRRYWDSDEWEGEKVLKRKLP